MDDVDLPERYKDTPYEDLPTPLRRRVDLAQRPTNSTPLELPKWLPKPKKAKKK
jgi:hypothetical protein